MFKLAKERKVWWPITVKLPKEGGGFEEFTCSILYRLIDREEIKAQLEGLKRDDAGFLQKFARKLADNEDDYLRTHVLDWKDVLDQDEKPIPFTFETLKAANRDIAFNKALMAGLQEASYGAEQKN